MGPRTQVVRTDTLTEAQMDLMEQAGLDLSWERRVRAQLALDVPRPKMKIVVEKKRARR